MSLYLNPRQFQNDEKGRSAPYATLDFYDTATFDRKNTYSDIGLTSPLPNPVVADAAGRFPKIYLAVDSGYRVVYSERQYPREDAPLTLVWTEDDVWASLGADIIGTDPDEIPTNADLYVDSIEDLPAVIVGQQIRTAGYYSGSTVGGLNPGKGVASAVHDGIRYFDPDRVADIGTPAYYTPAAAVPCWERVGVDRVYVEMAGAKGDGVADDTAAVNSAITMAGIYGTVIFPDGLKSFLITSELIQLQGQQWEFKGGQRASKLLKGYNGNVIRMATLGRAISPFVDANGFTGTNILIKAGTFSQYLENVRTVGSSSPGVLYETNAGGGSRINGIEGDTTDPDNVGVIALTEDTTSVPRFWDNVYLSGGVIDIRGGGNGLSVNGFYIKDILTGYAGAVPTRSALYKFSNGRLADLGETSTITAADGFYNNVSFSSNVTLDDCQGVKFTPTCTFSSITENPNSRFNSWFDQSNDFPTVWKASDGSLGDIGNGTLTMKQTRKGHFCRVVFEFIYGSTTTLPSGTGQWTFTLPFPGQQSFTLNGVFANFYDSSGPADSFALGQVPADTATLGFGLNGQAVRNGYPFVWATGDRIFCEFEYEVK